MTVLILLKAFGPRIKTFLKTDPAPCWTECLRQTAAKG